MFYIWRVSLKLRVEREKKGKIKRKKIWQKFYNKNYSSYVKFFGIEESTIEPVFYSSNQLHRTLTNKLSLRDSFLYSPWIRSIFHRYDFPQAILKAKEEIMKKLLVLWKNFFSRISDLYLSGLIMNHEFWIFFYFIFWTI